MRIPSSMPKDFSKVPQAYVPRSSFNRTFGHKTTFDVGYLIPVFVDEVVPGDTIRLNMTGFARLATPLHPFMDNLFIETQWFFIPNRLLWNNWQKFMGEQENPDDSIDYIVPEITSPAGGYARGSIMDYMGFPTSPDLGANTITHQSLFFRAYNLTYNQWYRDENLQDSRPVPKGDGPDAVADFTLQRRGKRFDYFTSCLPFPQKGPAVDLPLGSSAPVIGIGKLNQNYSAGANSVYETGASSSQLWAANTSTAVGTSSDNLFYVKQDPDNPGFPGIYADLTEATAATINALREAVAMQELFEKDARGGTRYTEIIRSHFGVVSPDARLQRVEFLGAGSSPINITPIAQNSASTVDSPQGNLAAIGTATLPGGRHGFMKSFTEHGIVLGLMSVRADLNYQQGLDRMYSRSTRYDYYLPVLAHLGEQAVLNKEIMATGGASDELVFGYQERWAEMRYRRNLITGKFRSNDPQSLDTWHLAQDFATVPQLNAEFIVDDPPIERVLAVTDEPHLIFDSHFQYTHVRPMPTYSIPGFGSRF